MICQQFEQLASQIAHNELGDAKLLQDAINHAASCAACDATLVEARELAVSVSALAAHDKALDSVAHLEFTLRAAFAREHAAKVPSRSKIIAGTGLRFARFGWHAFAMAGATIIVAMFLFSRVLEHNSATDRAALRPPQTSSPAPTTTTSAKTVPPTPSLAPVTQKHLTVSQKPKKNPYEPEKTLTGFMALPYADDLSTIQYGAIVRLQLSRADLAWYGLPVPISDSGQKITADLFVNGSGTPEAIRLVR
jgi:cell division septation protein DedD